MNHLQKICIAFELHDAITIRNCLEDGLSPNEIYQGKPIIFELINMYTRGPKLKACIQAFVDYGLHFEDQALLAVLLDDANLLSSVLQENKSYLFKTYTFNATFTPLFEVTLLHICAEYNHTKCAEALIEFGADLNAKAGIDELGFGGQTPIFHCVNQDANKSIEVLKLLISKHANLDIQVKGLIWGKDYDWETFIPDVNPISYAMMGLLRQFQRTEQDIYEVVGLLLKAKYGISYEIPNIPNKYLET